MASGIYSPKALQIRKEEDLKADSIGRSKEGNQARRGEEDGPDVWARIASQREREKENVA
jgi:hypothetical protein